MKQLWLTPAHAYDILAHAQQDSPNEACGLIVGHNEMAETIIHIKNVAAHPTTQYYMDEASLVRAITGMHRNGQKLLGIYHSHPAGTAIPSPTDIHEATYPEAAYVIIGLKHSEPEIAVWHIQHGQIKRTPLHIAPEEMLPEEDSESELSNAQHTAVILAGIITVILVLVTALTLLPPAPVIDPRLLNQLPR